MILNTLFMTQNTLFVNQMTKNTLFWAFTATVEKITYALGEHGPGSAKDWRTATCGGL